MYMIEVGSSHETPVIWKNLMIYYVLQHLTTV